MKITQLPEATAVTDSDIAVIVQDGETRQIPRTLLTPRVAVDTELSGTSENPVQNKVITAAIQELEAGVNEAFRDQAEVMGQIIANTPTDLKLENNQLQLVAGNTAIGNGVQIQKAPILLDTFTIAVGEEPVAYYSKNIVASNCRRVLIFGELRSDDETEKSRSIWLGTNTGFNFHNSAAINISATSTVYFSAEVLLIPRNRNDFAVKGKTTVGKYVYTGGTYQENVGRTYLEPYAYLSGVTVKINGANMVAGTNFNVWGLE